MILCTCFRSFIFSKVFICSSLSSSESPYSEPGVFEEGEQDGGTETQTSEEGKSLSLSLSHTVLEPNYASAASERCGRSCMVTCLHSNIRCGSSLRGAAV